MQKHTVKKIQMEDGVDSLLKIFWLCDKTSLDISWMKANSETDDYTLTELLDMIKEKSNNIAKAVAELEQLIGKVEE